jgi:hypothetical protein
VVFSKMEMERTYYSDDNGRDTPKESFEMPIRADTPGPLPKYRYSRVSMKIQLVCDIFTEKILFSTLSHIFLDINVITLVINFYHIV